MTKKRFCRAMIRAAACFCLLTLSSCEQIFTFSPFTFLQRPPETLTPEQQIQYGKDALASGDVQAMQDAYDLLSEDTDSAEAQYVAAELAIELSGMSEYFLQVAAGTATLPTAADQTSIQEYVSGGGVDMQLLIDAAHILQNAQALGQELEPVDYLMGGLGLVLDAAQQPDGTLDFGAMDAAELSEAEAFVTQDSYNAILAALPVDDPLAVLLSGFQDYVLNL